ncbi:MAG: hypothetical protein RL166_849 [Actinomycetota bacterium]
MGIFGERKSAVETEIDSFLEQKILLPQTFLRKSLLNESVVNGEPFWQGKVFLKCRDAFDEKPVPSLIFDVLHDGKLIGQISEFDSVAKSVLNFEPDQKYVARAIIRADLIGNLVHLFVNPDNSF